MGRETTLFCGIRFIGEEYNRKGDVISDLNEVKNSIDCIKNKVIGYAVMTEPVKMIIPDDEEAGYGRDLVDDIVVNVRGLLNELSEYEYEKVRLEMLLEHWDACHNDDGSPKRLPDTIDYLDGAFIDGDIDG